VLARGRDPEQVAVVRPARRPVRDHRVPLGHLLVGSAGQVRKGRPVAGGGLLEGLPTLGGLRLCRVVADVVVGNDLVRDLELAFAEDLLDLSSSQRLQLSHLPSLELTGRALQPASGAASYLWMCRSIPSRSDGQSRTARMADPTVSRVSMWLR